MRFVYSDTADTYRPSDALFNAHFTSSVLMAVYLIGGASLAAVALLGVAYSPQLIGTWALAPYALMVTTLLWFTLGALLIHKHEQHLEHCSRTSNTCANRYAPPAQPTATPYQLDEPWELRAFWGHAASSPSTTIARAHAGPAVVQATASNARTARTASSATYGVANTLEVDLIASMNEHKSLRPISLFGSVQ